MLSLILVVTKSQEPGEAATGRAEEHPGERRPGGGTVGLADGRPGVTVHQGEGPHT